MPQMRFPLSNFYFLYTRVYIYIYIYIYICVCVCVFSPSKTKDRCALMFWYRRRFCTFINFIHINAKLFGLICIGISNLIKILQKMYILKVYLKFFIGETSGCFDIWLITKKNIMLVTVYLEPIIRVRNICAILYLYHQVIQFI
jgi:hypothetical protein